ncbi:MAG: integrin alpha, partial [Planctomycetota bacterium]
MLTLAAALLLASPSASPVTTQGGAYFGRSVLLLSDLDGDGTPEVAVGAPAASIDARQQGAVLVLSGATREVLQRWTTNPARTSFGHALRGAGDTNGDGTDDILVGFAQWRSCEIRSGVDGALLRRHDRDWREVIAFGDFDQDGADDLLLAIEDRWEVRSGRDGRLLAGCRRVRGIGRSIGGGAPVGGFGRFDPVGDLDGDGLTDGILVAEPSRVLLSGAGEGPRGPETSLFEPGHRPIVDDRWSPILGERGLVVDAAFAAGDLDGNGRPDVLLSGPSMVGREVVGLSPLVRTVPAMIVATSFGSALLGGIDLDGNRRADLVAADRSEAFGPVGVTAFT